MQDLTERLAQELNWNPRFTANALGLLDDGNTIPFVARYRKELTGTMDEVRLRQLKERAQYLRELEERRGTVLDTISSQGKLTPELESALREAPNKQVLEDLYLPFRPKRRTRATAAREKGLAPLTGMLFDTRTDEAGAQQAIASFLEAHEGELDPEAVWAGCRDIMAETVSEHAPTRAWIREITWKKGYLNSSAVKDYAGKKSKFKDYYDYREPLRTIPAHRYLALRRGEAEKVLRVQVDAPVEEILRRLEEQWCAPSQGLVRQQWRLVLQDAYKRLVAPSIEAEFRTRLKEAADSDSIAIFGQNLQALLLHPPGGNKVVLGLDPGFRTGSKWVVVDATGRVLDHGAIYPLPPRNQAGEAAQTLVETVKKHKVEVIAIGNGTASRELLAFVRHALAASQIEPQAELVSEAGASVYSASELAGEEFPDLDVSVRGAVSIARRWQDPLSELVKIDPRSIGVGQYQHDVQQNRLRAALDETVESCVNQVGVNLNSASWSLLRYVAGVGGSLAREIVVYREARGAFRNRAQLLNVPRMGAMVFRQCAGFLRIGEGDTPLDRSAVHPEHYPVVERMAGDLAIPLADLIGQEQQVKRLQPERYVSGEAGLPTIEDILAELKKPGRDPRMPGSPVQFDEAITEIGHLRAGMKLNGVVSNVTHFGAFVDIGVHQDGLVHISQLADRFVNKTQEIVRVGQAVSVTVLSIDPELGRIALSMKSNPPLGADSSPGRGKTRPPRQGLSNGNRGS